jgi:hypothetical protein
MPREVAHAYLLAAAEAWPFVSEPAHRRRTLRLARTTQHRFTDDTQALARDLEAWLRPRAAGLSLEALRRLCDFAWFDGAPRDRPLATVLHDLATRTLQRGGSVIHLQRDGDLPERLAHFRWLSLLLPPDLLIAAFSPEPTTDRVSLLTPQLSEMLTERPVAETHVHLNAAMSFGVLWTGLTSSFAHHAPAPKDDREDDPPPFGDHARFLSMLAAALIGRLLLARFLWRRETHGAAGPLTGTLHDEIDASTRRLGWPGGAGQAAFAMRGALRTLVTGEPSALLPYPRLLLLHRLLLGSTPVTPPRSLDDLERRDPLAAWLPPGPGRALPETRFAAKAIRYLLNEGEADTEFARLFWQYTRVRCLTYRRLVQEPGTAGLDWFQRHFNRARPFRAALGRCRFEAALAHAAPGVQLGSFEARIAPSGSAAALRGEIRGIRREAERARHDERWPPPEIAVVAHFLKEREQRANRPFRLHADPRQLIHGVRFGTWGYARLTEAMAIESALRAWPELLIHLRGLDVASTELAVPTWAILPAFVRARRASLRASERLARRGSAHVPPLRATCHAGEDYLRLVEGLRRIHEPIEFGMLDAGDRVGHGFALGVDPERWARGAAEIMQPAEDRLDDLLWELDRYGRGEVGVDSGRFAHARAEALRIGRAIYGSRIDVDTLIEARRMRHDRRWLARFGYPFLRWIRPRPDAVAEEALYAYLTRASVFQRGLQVEPVRVTDGEIAFLRGAQVWLRRELARLEITVESNPSSNLLIGDLLSVEEHPSFQLQPLPGRAADGCPVLLSVNTDDPITFATSIADEYAHLYGALLRDKVPAHDALTWLAARRDQGFRSRFSLPRGRPWRS